MNLNPSRQPRASRRNFIKTSTLAGSALAFGIAAPQRLFAENTDTLRVGLVGCGGRGSGAARDALNADPNCVLVAVGDVFEAAAKGAVAAMKREASMTDRVKVTPETTFSGLDAYQKVIGAGVDVVLLCTPPGFRPQHLKAAVDAGKHVFCEKPMATDVPGVRSVFESAAKAKEKHLALVAGFCWRADQACREFYARIHDGMIGSVRHYHATYLTGPVKPMPPASTRPAGMGDVEWQLRNWYNFVWICGDGLVEQACHSVDKIAWAMNGVLPVKCTANGGRNIPNNEGNIFDHIDVFFEFPDGVRATMAQRQISNCYTDNSDYIVGSTGVGRCGWNAPSITGENKWRHRGPNPGAEMYVQEHRDLYASIRKGEPQNDGVWMTNSTLMAIMGRTAAYTGQELTWEQIMGSTEAIVAPDLKWDQALPVAPMAIPGKTRFV